MSDDPHAYLRDLLRHDANGMEVFAVAPIRRLLEDHDRLAADVEASATAFTVPLPEPGSDMARVMAANRRLTAERDQLHERVDDLGEIIRAFVQRWDPDGKDHALGPLRAALAEGGNE